MYRVAVAKFGHETLIVIAGESQKIVFQGIKRGSFPPLLSAGRSGGGVEGSKKGRTQKL